MNAAILSFLKKGDFLNSSKVSGKQMKTKVGGNGIDSSTQT